jgi:hypothetical protein
VVSFKGNPAEIALATINSESAPGSVATASVHILEGGVFEVLTASEGTLTSERFELLLP